MEFTDLFCSEINMHDVLMVYSGISLLFKCYLKDRGNTQTVTFPFLFMAFYFGSGLSFKSSYIEGIDSTCCCCWEVVETLGGGTYLEDIGHWGCAIERYIGSLPPILSLFAY
jgi:hypothetical protein